LEEKGSDQMRTVQASIMTSSAPERALAAFLDPGDLRSWWGVGRALVQPHKGGLYALAWGVTTETFAYITTAVVGEYEPGRLLRLDNYTYFNPARPILGPMSLTVRARIEGAGGACIEVIQDGYGDGPDWDWYYEAVRGAWPMALGALRDYLAHIAQ
jgi:hypothetical protein